MSLYRWIVEHPVAVWMMTIALMVFGLVSYARLPLNLMPDLSYPTLTVRTAFEGAAPEEVEQQVSRPIEEALATVEGLVSIESRSRAGVSDVVLEFEWDTSMAQASQSVREQLQTLYLGTGVDRPLLLRYDPSLDPILRIVLSTDGRRSEAQLRSFAEQQLRRDLETVEGVAAITVRGGVERQVRVEPREDWLSARGVSLSMLSAALTAGNVNMAGGVVREGENEYLVRTLNEVRTLDEIRLLPIPISGAGGSGAVVHIGEVAAISEEAAERLVLVRLDGQDAVELQVFKEASANLVTSARAVKAALGAMGWPEGVEWRVIDDSARFVELALDNLVDDAVIGGILCILITFLFLRDWTSTFIISSAIPICLVVTFAVMNVGGISLNLMSLGGLALGVSMVVDSGTVVLESVQRHLDAGVPRREAAIRGTSEVATAVFASVLTGIAVFFPIVFVEGVAGQIFGDLALAVVFSLLTSLAVALVFIPMLAAREVQIAPPPRMLDISTFSPRAIWQEFRSSWRWWSLPWALVRAALELAGGAMLWLFTVVSAVAAWAVLRLLWGGWRLFDRFSLWGADHFLRAYGWCVERFERGLLDALGRPARVMAAAAALFALSLWGFTRVGAELVPTVHEGRFTAEVALPVGTPLDVTDATTRQIEREVAALRGVASVYTVVGTEGGVDARSDEGENTARLLVQASGGEDLEELEERLMEQIRAVVAEWPRTEVHFRRPALFSVHTPLEVVLYDPDLDRLRAASDAAIQELSALTGITDVRSSLGRGYPEVRIRYDRETLSRMGLGVGEVARAVRAKIQGETPTRVHRGEQRVELLLRLDEQDRSSLADLGAINVNPKMNPVIRLDTVARLSEAEGPSEIRRVDQQRAVVLSASLEGFDLSGASARIGRAMGRAGLGVEYDVAGQSRELQASMGSLQLALGLAIFLVYVIMASTFESLRDPLIILFSVPLALIGVAVGLWGSGNPVSVMVFLGLIVLAGVVVANAIVLVDAINRLRSEGQPLQAAIQMAAAERLRPILITALNSVLGLLPLAVGLGEGSEIQRPMAVTIIFGLSSSTVLTLVVVPVVYRLAARLTEGPGAEGPRAGTGPGAPRSHPTLSPDVGPAEPAGGAT